MALAPIASLVSVPPGPALLPPLGSIVAGSASRVAVSNLMH
jgi:hypothetical protein